MEVERRKKKKEKGEKGEIIKIKVWEEKGVII